jgi:hypothetical protein
MEARFAAILVAAAVNRVHFVIEFEERLPSDADASAAARQERTTALDGVSVLTLGQRFLG